MVVGYMRVSSESDRQTVQREALPAAGVHGRQVRREA
jgi:hypothetical protein